MILAMIWSVLFVSVLALEVQPPSNSSLYASLFLAYSAFCPSSRLLAWTCSWCVEPLLQSFVPVAVLFNTTYDTRGYVAFSVAEQLIVVSFRGSNAKKNWWLDLDPRTTKAFRNTTVHAGWLSGFEELRTQMYNAIAIAEKACPDCNSFLVTGHSLGAAESAIAAVDLSYARPRAKVSVINFGSPRVGHQDFAALLESRVALFRVVHFEDIVPHYPLMEPFGYRHSFTELWEPFEVYNGTFIVCKGEEDPHCADSVKPWDFKPSDHMVYLGVRNSNCV
jgi:hypothetical protein